MAKNRKLNGLGKSSAVPDEFRTPPTWCAVVILLTLALVPYLNSLRGGFQFDDRHQIIDNPIIRNIEHIFVVQPTRALPFLTFLINHKLHGFDWMPGWHVTNMLLHASCSLALYLAMRLLLLIGARRGGLFLSLQPRSSPVTRWPANRSTTSGSGRQSSTPCSLCWR